MVRSALRGSTRSTMHVPCQFDALSKMPENRENPVRDEPAFGYTLLN